MVEQDPGPGVHVRERVLRPAVLREHAGRYFAVQLYELEERVGGDFGPGRGKGQEGGEARVWFAEDGVPVAGDHAPGSERRPEVGGYGGGSRGGADVGLHLEEEAEDFLRGETECGLFVSDC